MVDGHGAGIDWEREALRLRDELMVEHRRRVSLQDELKKERQMSVSRQAEAEAEEERLTNKLLARLDELKATHHSLRPEVEAEQGLVDELRARLTALSADKAELESRLAAEQAYVSGTLLRRAREVEADKAQLLREKAALENALEAEQEFISNRLSKRVEELSLDRNAVQAEKLELRRQVAELRQSVDRLIGERCSLEAGFEREEEQVVNRLQRQLQAVTRAYCALEARLEGAGLTPHDAANPPLDATLEWVYGRSPSRAGGRLGGLARSRSRSSSATGSVRAAQGSGILPGTPMTSSVTSANMGTGLALHSPPQPEQEALQPGAPGVDLARRSSSSVTSSAMGGQAVAATLQDGALAVPALGTTHSRPHASPPA